MKQCRRCKLDKPLDEFRLCFPKDPSKAHRRQSWCKACFHENNLRWQQAHPERHRSRNRAWQVANPDKVANLSHRRRAIQNGATRGTVTSEDWRRLCTRFQHRCAYCGEKRKLTQDHVFPLSRGGSHSIGNILPACAVCNAKKKARFLVELGWRVGRV